jgi:Ca2+-binding EF-hand superfamily protein
VTRALLAALPLVAVVLVYRSPAEPPKSVATRADALELLLLTGDKPERLELRATVDGKSVPAVWDDTFAKLLAFFDRDGNGSLDKAEAARLPSAFALRQVLWGQLTPFTGTAPPLTDLDTDKDGKVGGEELADFYRRAGLGGELVGIGKPPATAQLTDALMKRLDKDKDGKVSTAEWKAAPVSLAKLDANDDELIGPGELVDKVAYPGALGSILLAAPTAADKPDPVTDTFPLLALPLRTGDTHWANTVATRREKAKQPALSTDAILGLRKSAPAVVWQAMFSKEKESGILEPAGGKPSANGQLVHSSGPVRFELRSDAGKLAETAATARKRWTAQFAEFDADADDTLSPKELAAPKANLFKQLLAVADRDGNDDLSGKELGAWLDLQDRIANGHVLLTVLDHGAGLFEVLDADRDGSLSVRELRTAWERLKAAGCVTAGMFDRTKLPRQLLATVSRGHPQSTLGKPVRGGPAWFAAMDRNGDGDVSRKEFTGPADVFDKLDADRDGLLSAEEAAKAEAKK